MRIMSSAIPDVRQSSWLPTTASQPLRVAVIGCGHIARLIYLPVLLGHSRQGDIRVTALCDVRRASAESLASMGFGDARIYSDAAELLNCEVLDAALVLTTETKNAETARLVQKAGLPVYLEKPPAQNLLELSSMMEAEKRGEGLVYAAFNRRHIPLFQDATKQLGKLVRARGVLARTDRVFDTFLFTGIHLVDSVQYYAGSKLVDWEISCEREGIARWHLAGRLECGASCELEFVPAGERVEEILTFEYEKGMVRELHFPDPNPVWAEEVRWIERCGGEVIRSLTAPKEGDALERMGYAPAFSDFLKHLGRGDLASSFHRLSSCVTDIEILVDMMQCLQRHQLQKPGILVA